MATAAELPSDTPTEQQLPRDHMISVLQAQPVDSSYDELLKALAAEKMFDRGLADLKAGRIRTHEEVGEQIKSWQS